MKKSCMKRVLLLLVLALPMMSMTVDAQSVKSDIVGLWQVINVKGYYIDKAGKKVSFNQNVSEEDNAAYYTLGRADFMQYDFFDDGYMRYRSYSVENKTWVLESDFKYQYDGKTLTLTDGRGNVIDKYPLEMSNGKLYMTVADEGYSQIITFKKIVIDDSFNTVMRKAQNGDKAAQFKVGLCYVKGDGVERDFNKSFAWFRKSAEQGYKEAQHNLGVSYENGWGCNRNFSEAIRWYRKAAEQGYAASQLSLGGFYYTGKGVEKDLRAAYSWFKKAADQANVRAMNNLANCYYYGEGVERNYSEAARWYGFAAEMGNDEAQTSLGVCYYNGQGVDKDYSKAAYWFRKAAEKGNEEAKKNLPIAESKIKE